jgi:hypothetical protein
MQCGKIEKCKCKNSIRQNCKDLCNVITSRLFNKKSEEITTFFLDPLKEIPNQNYGIFWYKFNRTFYICFNIKEYLKRENNIVDFVKSK